MWALREKSRSLARHQHARTKTGLLRIDRLLCLIGSLATSHLAAGEITIEKSAEGATVKVDGQLFTKYHIRSGNKPILWPLIGPTGKPMTRAYPMAAGPSEQKDHPHHRSLWFTHGDVDGLSFWHERQGSPTVKHKRFIKIQGDTIVTENDWLDPQGKRHLQDRRALRFEAGKDHRSIDFTITLTAVDQPVHLGDTKEGSFGLRVAGTMKVDAQLGGQIVNCEGHRDKRAWGKPAAWVDYHGPVDGQRVGIAIFNHPRSFRFPTYWHVRTYGLFAANPFGQRDFTAGKKQGDYHLPRGESVTLHYRVWLHRGDHQEGQVARAFASYARSQPPSAGTSPAGR